MRAVAFLKISQSSAFIGENALPLEQNFKVMAEITKH